MKTNDVLNTIPLISCDVGNATQAKVGEVVFERYEDSDRIWHNAPFGSFKSTPQLQAEEATFHRPLTAPEGMDLLLPGDPRRTDVKPEGTMWTVEESGEWVPCTSFDDCWNKCVLYAIPATSTVEYRELTAGEYENPPKEIQCRYKHCDESFWGDWTHSEITARDIQDFHFRIPASIPPPVEPLRVEFKFREDAECQSVMIPGRFRGKPYRVVIEEITNPVDVCPECGKTGCPRHLASKEAYR